MLRAALFAALTAVLVTVAFSVWKKRTDPIESAQALSRLDAMEQGVPQFQAKTINGNTVSMDDFKGRLVILNFWASWCNPCISEIPSLASLVKRFNGQISLIAVSEDEKLSDLQAFLKSFPELKSNNIYVVFDESRELMTKYGTERLPESYLIGKQGKLIKKVVGSIDWHTPHSEEFIKEHLAK